MNLEDNLRDRLESVETPPTRVDVDMLVVAGRRRAFRRRSAEAAGGIALVAAVLLTVPWVLNATDADPVIPPGETVAPTTPPPATTRTNRCPMQALPVPAEMNRDTMVSAVDPTGRYITGNDVVGRAVLWTDGQPRLLSANEQAVEADAVNSSGVVAGYVTEGTRQYTFRYHDGTLTRLDSPPGDWRFQPEPAINAAGDIVVNAVPRGDSGGEGGIVVLWKAGATTATRLPLPAGAEVFDISDDGRLFGNLPRDGAATEAYVWDQRGGGRKLPRPAGVTAAWADAVAGDWVAGLLWRGKNASTALWNLRTGAVTDLKTSEVGHSVNTLGWVVNALGDLLRDGADPVLEVPDGQSGKARDVSDTGLVVGQAFVEVRNSIGDNLGPRVWRC
jgi:hypothetical protein